MHIANKHLLNILSVQQSQIVNIFLPTHISNMFSTCFWDSPQLQHTASLLLLFLIFTATSLPPLFKVSLLLQYSIFFLLFFYLESTSRIHIRMFLFQLSILQGMLLSRLTLASYPFYFTLHFLLQATTTVRCFIQNLASSNYFDFTTITFDFVIMSYSFSSFCCLIHASVITYHFKLS